MLLGDRYKLFERLGEGGMAEVFRAEDRRLGREVAVKVLRAQYAGEKAFLDRFMNEARSMAGFSHPNVVNVYDVGQHEQRYFIVMEYVPGEDLRKLLEESGALPGWKAVAIARRMASGIGYAHRKGLVHRDVKPGNILITPRGDVKVADFGIAKAMASAAITDPGVVWGTTAYLSPEQVRGEPAIPASDVYAIGVVLYEMLAGEPPFRGEDRVAIALKHLNEEPPPFQAGLDVPQDVERLVRKALAKDPAHRFEEADDMARALAEFSDSDNSEVTVIHSEKRPTETRPAPTAVMEEPARPARAAQIFRRSAAATTELVERRGHREIERRYSPSQDPQGRAAVDAQPAAPITTSGVDWVAIGLALLAFALLLGLVPLYLRVFSLL